MKLNQKQRKEAERKLSELQQKFASLEQQALAKFVREMTSRTPEGQGILGEMKVYQELLGDSQ